MRRGMERTYIGSCSSLPPEEKSIASDRCSQSVKQTTSPLRPQAADAVSVAYAERQHSCCCSAQQTTNHSKNCSTSLRRSEATGFRFDVSDQHAPRGKRLAEGGCLLSRRPALVKPLSDSHSSFLAGFLLIRGLFARGCCVGRLCRCAVHKQTTSEA